MGREITLALAFAVMGLLFYTRNFLLWLNALNPIEGFTVYYAILYAAMFILSKMDLVVFGIKIKSAVQTIGLMMITFAFFLVVNWQDPYVQFVTQGTFIGASNVLTNISEDGLVWYLWTRVIPATPGTAWVLHILAFVVSPFLIAIVGGILASGRKIKL